MSIQSKTVIFITGAFVSNSSWAPWQTYFESKGYTTLAPGKIRNSLSGEYGNL